MHAEGARHVAGGGHHAATAATDDHRLVGKAWIVPLLDRCVEGVAVDVRQGEGQQFRVRNKARAAAIRAACTGRDAAEAISAKRGGDGLLHRPNLLEANPVGKHGVITGT